MINTKWFQVPQSRARLIWIGIRKDLGIEPSFPGVGMPIITVRQAIGEFPIGSIGKHSPQVLAAWNNSRPGKSLRATCRYVGSFQSVRLDPGKPSPTQIKAHCNWHFAIARQLSPSEAQTIQSYPSAFQLSGGRGQKKEQIGNSVPPLFMRTIALHVKGLLN